jgi:DNA-binding transcriptional ArsR family regulator
MLQPQAPTIQIEDLGSIGILRTLTAITRHGPINISHLSRKIRLNYTSTDRHVKKLTQKGLVTEQRYGAIRMIKPSFDTFTVTFKKGMNVKINLSSKTLQPQR